MSVEQNKKLAREFFERFDTGDVAGALDTLADDLTWWIAGKPEQLPSAGVHTKQQLAALLGDMAGRLSGGLRMTVKGLIAEGDKVSVEVESEGELRDGRRYEQQYHFLLTVRDGKISAVREYLDTQHVFATWFQR